MTTVLLPDLIATCSAALEPLRGLRAAAKDAVTAMVSKDGKIDSALFEANRKPPTAMPGCPPMWRRWSRCWNGPSAWRPPVAWANWNR